MKFDHVRKEEADTVLKLYRSLLGTPYCVWTEDYPTEKEVEFDFPEMPCSVCGTMTGIS